MPTDHEPSGDPTPDELSELQRMVSDNEKALGRARKMIDELKKHLGTDQRKSRTPARRRKRT